MQELSRCGGDCSIECANKKIVDAKEIPKNSMTVSCRHWFCSARGDRVMDAGGRIHSCVETRSHEGHGRLNFMLAPRSQRPVRVLVCPTCLPAEVEYMCLCKPGYVGFVSLSYSPIYCQCQIPASLTCTLWYTFAAVV